MEVRGPPRTGVAQESEVARTPRRPPPAPMPHLISASLVSPCTLTSTSFPSGFSTRSSAASLEPAVQHHSVQLQAEFEGKWGTIDKLASSHGVAGLDDGLVSFSSLLVKLPATREAHPALLRSDRTRSFDEPHLPRSAQGETSIFVSVLVLVRRRADVQDQHHQAVQQARLARLSPIVRNLICP